MSAYNISQARILDKEEIIDFLTQVFSVNASPRLAQERIIFHEPSIRPENFIVARAPSQELIGLIRIVERTMMVDGCALACGGISSVAVHEKWQGQGICSRMMHTAIGQMLERNFDIAVLHARKAVDGFYTRFGFWGVGRYLNLEVDTAKAAGDTLMVKDYEPRYLEDCQRLYRQTYLSLSGSTKRSPAVWKYLEQQLLGHGPVSLQLCFDQKELVGYFVKDAKAKMIELCLPSRYYANLAQGLKKHNIQGLAIHPLHLFFHFCRQQYNTIFTERLALNGGYQAKLLQVPSLFKKLMPAFLRRARGWDQKEKKVSLLGYRLDLGKGQITKAQGKDDLRLSPQHRMVQAVLGSLPPDEILGVDWPKHKPWMKELFPYLHFHTNAWDEV